MRLDSPVHSAPERSLFRQKAVEATDRDAALLRTKNIYGYAHIQNPDRASLPVDETTLFTSLRKYRSYDKKLSKRLTEKQLRYSRRTSTLISRTPIIINHTRRDTSTLTAATRSVASTYLPSTEPQGTRRTPREIRADSPSGLSRRGGREEGIRGAGRATPQGRARQPIRAMSVGKIRQNICTRQCRGRVGA